MICVIPARRGSKRLPEKNLLPLAGKPLIAYSIETALESGCFSQVYVATEDKEIAKLAQSFGASVPLLVPQDHCTDLIPSHQPCQFLVENMPGIQKEKETLVVLQPTSPLRSIEDIQKSLEIFSTNQYDFLVSATPIDPHYFHWGVIPKNNGYWEMYFGNQFMKERPLLPPVYRPNGSIKIAKLDVLKKTGNFFGPKLGVIETPEERSIHIATKFEFDFCEFILKRNKTCADSKVKPLSLREQRA